MRKFYYAVILMAVVSFITLQCLRAQERGQGDILYSCWEETVKPELYREYLEASRELADICKEIQHPFPYAVWEARSMVIQYWTPLEELNDIESIGPAWDKVLERFGKERIPTIQNNVLHQYSMTATVLGDLSYWPDDPGSSPGDRTYCRWIEIPLKPGTGPEFEKAVKWINEKREEHQVEMYVNVARGDLGFEQPNYVVTYYDVSENAFDEHYDSFPQEYKDSYQEYLARIRKLFRSPPELLDYYLLSDLSYTPE